MKMMLKTCRILLLLLTLFQIAYNYLADLWIGVSIPEVTYRYDNPLVPAGYAFSIWLLIYLAQLVYAVVQVLPASQNKKIYDIIAVPLMMSYLFSIGWGTAFRLGNIPLSMCCLAAMLVAAFIVYVKVHTAVDTGLYSPWLTLPFRLYAGWLSVANIAGFTIWLVYAGVFPGTITLIILVLIPVIAAVLVLRGFRDPVYPLVVCWALLAVWVAQHKEYPLSSYFSLFMALLLLLLVLLYRKRTVPV